MRSKSRLMLDVERRRQRPIEDDLRDLTRNHSQREIARLYGVNIATVNHWLLRFGIPSRRWAPAEPEAVA